ncbi:PREDICTED: outer dense fiber protein 4 [Galeopterus variegatus]|uniref:Outer dense fiber protein 4 n=1 Tax=Galeopterus variegatus TaxID=482537 RepID=A0ABM0RH51_GALVR|nr:PREDICTED: outer dense fiber protein 4 [Galeopterus variegatus]
MGAEESMGEFPGSGGDTDQHQYQWPGKEEEGWKAGGARGEPGTGSGVQTFVHPPSSNRRVPTDHHRHSVLPFQWRVTHSSRWIEQVLASELSLIAFILMLVMVFSKKWLYLSGSRFYQRWPKNVSNSIYTSAHIMSMGLLYICYSSSCSDSGKVIFVFFTLVLFPINLWIFEVESNVSIPIGQSYIIGWLVFILYVTCATLCYVNHKSFWSVILSRPSGTMSCSTTSSSESDSLNGQTVSDTATKGESPGS